jgi:hypothetical protein
MKHAWLVALLVSCSKAESSAPLPLLDAGSDAAILDTSAPGFGDASVADASVCDDPIKPPALAASFGTLSPTYDKYYDAFDLGPLPLPIGESDPLFFDPVGGCVVDPTDVNRLYFVGKSEGPLGAIYTVGLKRDACGHILSFVGPSKRVVGVPFADANFVELPGASFFLTLYPIGGIAELDPAMALLKTHDLKPLGLDAPVNPAGIDLLAGESPGGLARVPPGLPRAGELRALAYPSGNWFVLDAKKTGATHDFTKLTKKVTLDNGAGPFAYVPAGSPGFPTASVVLTEWYQGRFYPSIPINKETQRVVAYEIDAESNPIKSTRKEFFTLFDKPWGAYFEPVTGDFLFLSWLRSPDHIVAVRGFAKPPPVK